MAPILIILIVLLLLVVAGSFVRRRAAAIRAEDAAVARGLRQQILDLTPDDVGLAVAPDDPFAIVMDLGYPDAVVSIVSVATGDASLYVSTGGGVIGGAGHANVREAALAFVAEAKNHSSRFALAAETPYATAGNVRFYVRTASAVRVAEANELALQEGSDALAPLYAAGQNVITQLRITQGG